MTLHNVTISTNTATGGTLGEGDGGGIVLGNGKPIVAANSTIAFNAATTAGGGIVGLSPPAAPSSLVSVIVSNNVDLGGPGDIAPGPFGMGQTMTIEGSSDLVVASPAAVALPPGTLSDDPALLPLTTNDGGMTAVHPLPPNSLAIDAGGVLKDLSAISASSRIDACTARLPTSARTSIRASRTSSPTASTERITASDDSEWTQQ